MLFGREYMPEGAGVDPDAPRKKGAARLWEILSRDLDGIFLSGTLAMLACAPAAILAGIALWLGSLPLCLLAAAAAGWLVGPALTCLYDTILRALRDEPGFWWHTYKRVWKQSFKSSLVPGIVFTLLWTLVAYAAAGVGHGATADAGQLLLDAERPVRCLGHQKAFQLRADAAGLSAPHCPFGGIPAGVLAADGSCHPALRLYFPAHRAVAAQPAGKVRGITGGQRTTGKTNGGE